MSEKIIAYKATDKNMMCRGKQYEVGKTYTEEKADCSTGAASGNYSTGAASGDCSTGAASGNYSTGAASGNYSTGAASGDCSSAEVSGKDSIAVANGYNSKARGSIGCYIVLTEYDDDGKFLLAKMARVDGTVIKDGVWYTLKNGEFVEKN